MKCCICGEEIEGMSNSAWPIVNDERKRCCDLCNHIYVLAARIAKLKKRDVTEEWLSRGDLTSTIYCRGIINNEQ